MKSGSYMQTLSKLKIDIMKKKKSWQGNVFV